MKLSRKKRKQLKSQGVNIKKDQNAQYAEYQQQPSQELEVAKVPEQKIENSPTIEKKEEQPKASAQFARKDLITSITITLIILLAFAIIYYFDKQGHTFANYGETLIQKLNIQL